jgi:hypothetical protein
MLQDGRSGAQASTGQGSQRKCGVIVLEKYEYMSRDMRSFG